MNPFWKVAAIFSVYLCAKLMMYFVLPDKPEPKRISKRTAITMLSSTISFSVLAIIFTLAIVLLSAPQLMWIPIALIVLSSLARDVILGYSRKVKKLNRTEGSLKTVEPNNPDNQ